jgi:hypothetical protein
MVVTTKHEYFTLYNTYNAHGVQLTYLRVPTEETSSLHNYVNRQTNCSIPREGAALDFNPMRYLLYSSYYYNIVRQFLQAMTAIIIVKLLVEVYRYAMKLQQIKVSKKPINEGTFLYKVTVYCTELAGLLIRVYSLLDPFAVMGELSYFRSRVTTTVQVPLGLMSFFCCLLVWLDCFNVITASLHLKKSDEKTPLRRRVLQAVLVVLIIGDILGNFSVEYNMGVIPGGNMIPAVCYVIISFLVGLWALWLSFISNAVAHEIGKMAHSSKNNKVGPAPNGHGDGTTGGTEKKGGTRASSKATSPTEATKTAVTRTGNSTGGGAPGAGSGSHKPLSSGTSSSVKNAGSSTSVSTKAIRGIRATIVNAADSVKSTTLSLAHWGEEKSQKDRNNSVHFDLFIKVNKSKHAIRVGAFALLLIVIDLLLITLDVQLRGPDYFAVIILGVFLMFNVVSLCNISAISAL